MRGRLFAGLLLILLGLYFILEQAGLISVDLGEIIAEWWPCIIVAAGLSSLGGHNKSVFAPLAMISVGLLLLANNFGILPWGFWGALWPIVLIILGISMIAGKKYYQRPAKYTGTDRQIYNAVFGGIEEKIIDYNFKGVTVNSSFGGIELDLRQCVISPDFEGIDISVAFGGVKLFVPHNWAVEPKGTPVFGGVENTSMPRGENIVVVAINYSCFFGGIDISN